MLAPCVDVSAQSALNQISSLVGKRCAAGPAESARFFFSRIRTAFQSGRPRGRSPADAASSNSQVCTSRCRLWPYSSALLHGALHRDDDVAQQLAAVVLVDVILPPFSLRGLQHVGGRVLVAASLFSSWMRLLSKVLQRLISAGPSNFSKSSTALQLRRMRIRSPEGIFYNILIVRDQHLIDIGINLCLCDGVLVQFQRSVPAAAFS